MVIIEKMWEKSNIFIHFSIDEWTSFANKGYIALELHVKQKIRFNLGLKKIDCETLPAEKLAELVTTYLREYGLDIIRHIVCIITDGPKIMEKLARVF